MTKGATTDRLAVLLLGPGTSITHSAMKSLVDNNCLVCWVGESGVRLYSHNTGGTHSSRRLLHQAAMFVDENLRLKVVRRLFEKRFTGFFMEGASIDEMRGMEGARVRAAYQYHAEQFKAQWSGRTYDQDDWDSADPLNKALSAANACLYGICHAAILSAGYSPAIGFIHTGKMLSFVYDISDLYKTETVVPVAFQVVAQGSLDVERQARYACREVFKKERLLSKIIPDIAEVLDDRDGAREMPGELEGRAVSLADRNQDWGPDWRPEREGERRTLENGSDESGNGNGDSSVE